MDEILPKWLAAVTDEGLFLPHFDRAWRPLRRNYGTLVSQCRLLYNFSQGYALTGDRTYRNAVEQGARFLLDHFRDRKYGGWYWSCGLDGEARDRRKDSYGHAFVIFGLAHAYHCTGDQALQEALLHTWDVLTQRFRDQHGGFIWRMTEAFAGAEEMRSQNPVMHLFEALLAAGTAGGVPSLLEETQAVGDFVLSKLVRKTDRRLPEVYNAEWAELSAAQQSTASLSGGRLDIGHAFEWAYLTSYAVEQGLPAEYMSYANSFMLYGLALGFDWQAGGIYSPASPAGQLMTQRKGWWEQCEAIRAMTHFVVRHHRADLLEPLQKTIAFVQTSLIDPVYGGWYSAIEPGVSPEGQEKGNEWKVDYHIVGMCIEAIRLSNQVM
ncbi:MAG TPA: AGE family epimerase/isomerase [Caldilineaceae bacterium]|nr:AGE family epimerase/isomerase [Caldilineaceae bacterium]